MFQKALIAISGIVLLQFCNAASAFTLIIPPEQISPGNTITDKLTIDAPVRSVASVIRAHLSGVRRAQRDRKTAQFGDMLAATSYAQTLSDGNGLKIAYNDLASAEGSSLPGGAGSGNRKSLWITSAHSSLKNDFSRTAFDGDIQNVLAGFDFTQSDKYVFGIAVSHETSRYDTPFNFGDEKTTGFNVSPYVAVLLSDVWSFDMSLGRGRLKTDQTRTSVDFAAIPLPAPLAVNSDFSSTRDFVSANLTQVFGWGNWKLTDSVGYMATRQKQDSYVESDGSAVAGSNRTRKAWNLAGEAAYSHGEAESYLGVVYERAIKPEKIAFSSGEQPANDPDSFLVSAGWRYFGKDLTANFVFSARLGQDQASEHGIATTIRLDF